MTKYVILVERDYNWAIKKTERKKARNNFITFTTQEEAEEYAEKNINEYYRITTIPTYPKVVKRRELETVK